MDHSFGKKERLCLKRRFERLLENGGSFFIYPFRVIYLVQPGEPDNFPVQVAFAVKKKKFKKAVHRNRIKRRCRESYRLHKDWLYRSLRDRGKSILLLLVYSADEVLTFAEIDRKIPVLFKRLLTDPELTANG